MKYGLIGEKLGHSFSKKIHNMLYNNEYELLEIKKDNIGKFLADKNFIAINVTIPYKNIVMYFLDSISNKAKEIGAVNTIVNNGNRLVGYNTDYYGLKLNIEKSNIDLNNKKVIILGTGGTSDTAYVVARDLNAKSIYKVSRKSVIDNNTLTYDMVYKKHLDSEIIINTTPCGMYPNNDDELIINIDKFHNLYAVVDVIYNPLQTKLIQEAKRLNLLTATGLYMLVAQAVYADSLFFKRDINDKSIITIINSIYEKIYKEQKNIVLIGMPSCGKTTIGKILSEKMDKEFIDVDNEFELKHNITCGEYISKYGDERFRDEEEILISDISKKNNVVISTGGGCVLRKINIDRLKQNGSIVYINRDLKLLQFTIDRPLSNDVDKLKRIYDLRKELYKEYSDITIKNDKDIDIVVRRIIEFVDNLK